MPTLRSHTHFQATQAKAQTKACKRVSLPNRTDRQESTGGNSTYKKLAVQWLIEHLCFVSNSLVEDSFALRNRHLRQARNRYMQAVL